MDSIILDDIFIAVGIMSPFLIFCSYGLLKRISWIASPKIVGPSVALVCSFFFLVRALNPHFLFAGMFILAAYYVLAFRLKYSKVDSLVLAVLVLMAIDQIWQIPWYVFYWSQNILFLEAGLRTAAWNMMSIPLIFYFIFRINGRIKLDMIAEYVLVFCVLFTGIDILAYPNPSFLYDPYLLVGPWFAFFLSVCTSSVPRLNVFGNPIGENAMKWCEPS